MIGIGIDTGGTYTDAVIYNLEKREIIAGAKSLTTEGRFKKRNQKSDRKASGGIYKRDGASGAFYHSCNKYLCGR